jgi:hypothetical protein
MKNATVHNLRKQGIKVRVIYWRYLSDDIRKEPAPLYFIKRYSLQQKISPKGGNVCVTLTNNGKDYIGKSVCSKEEPFEKRLGLNKALGRAISSMESGFA